VLDDRGRDSDGEFDPHDAVRRVLGKSSDEWGPSERRFELKGWLNSIDLEDAQRVIQAVGLDEDETALLNEALARAGEKLEVREDRILRTDDVATVLNVLHLERETTALLSGPFSAVLQQYQRALDFLDERPVEQEKAISEAVGALEAVVRIASNGGKDFGANATLLFRRQHAWTKLLGKTLGQLQGYRSQVPGAGHGRYAASDVTDAEVTFVVRAAGTAIAWIIEDHRDGRIP
jgi:hypothetical protein